jgi:hypothetical protein
MPTVGTILDLLPWVIFAPALPLLFILINKAYGNGRQTSLVLLCVITIFTNIFLLLAARSSVEPRFLHVSFVADFLFTLLLLKNCTDHRIIRFSIFTILLAFIAVYLSLQYFSVETVGIQDLNFTGTAIVFVLAILVLASLTKRVENNILTSPDFWYSGGIFFHFGLLSLLLFTGRKIADLNYHEKDALSALYAIIFCLQFVFFTVGVYFHKPWIRNNRASF